MNKGYAQMDENGNPNDAHDFSFQSLLYYRLIVSGDYSVATVAEKMHISSDSLYHYVESKTAFPIERLVDLINATGDIGFLTYFASKCGYTLVPKVRDKRLADSMLALANVLSAVAKGEK
jgi:hypothetical protein